jgi:hypothetical protein
MSAGLKLNQSRGMRGELFVPLALWDAATETWQEMFVLRLAQKVLNGCSENRNWRWHQCQRLSCCHRILDSGYQGDNRLSRRSLTGEASEWAASPHINTVSEPAARDVVLRLLAHRAPP